MEDSARKIFRRNSGWVVCLFLFWAIISGATLFYFSIFQREQLCEKSRQTAWRQGDLPALRGNILASDGRVLVSSEIEFFLFWKTDRAGDNVKKVLLRDLKNGGKLFPEELAKLEPLLQQNPFALKIEMKEVRNGSPAVEALEKKYDSVLAGKNGSFVVMLDRYGRRVPGTLKVIRQQVPGKSVRLSPEEEKELQ